MTQQFPPDEFDSWAENYDQDTLTESGFPFTGYSAVLRTIFKKAACQPGSEVLDLGIGTGNLALLFANAGCKIWGLDFSEEMLKLAQKKLPSAVLGLADLRDLMPAVFNRKFDAIVSAYTFHHFPLEEKLKLVIHLMKENLKPGGKLLIGDITFPDAASESAVRAEMGNNWEQEYYWLADENARAFSAEGISVSFTQVSDCAGVFEFSSRNPG